MQVIEARTERITQITGYYCGAACSQMLIKRQGITSDQNSIYGLIQNDNTESDAFYSDPDGISGVINSDNFDAFKSGDLTIFDNLSEADILDQLFDSIFDERTPNVCLVNSGNHWVVCHKISYNLTDKRDVSVLGVFLLDPEPSSSPETYVPIDQFLSTVLNANTFGQKWLGKRVLLSAVRHRNRSTSLNFASIQKSTKMKGGAGKSMDPINSETIIQNLEDIGISDVALPLGGGSKRLKISDPTDAIAYYISTFDARANHIFGGIIYAAVSPGGEILEVTEDHAQSLYAPDTLCNDIILSDPRAAEYEVDDGLYWIPNGLLRNRFLLARRLRKDDKVLWVLPSGELVSDLTGPKRGGR